MNIDILIGTSPSIGGNLCDVKEILKYRFARQINVGLVYSFDVKRLILSFPTGSQCIVFMD